MVQRSIQSRIFLRFHHLPHLLERLTDRDPEVNLRLQGLPTKYRFQLHQEPNSIDLQDTEYDTMEKHPRVNGIRPIGVEISTIERGSSSNALIAESMQNCATGSARQYYNLFCPSSEPSHQDPGRRHLIANKAFK